MNLFRNLSENRLEYYSKDYESYSEIDLFLDEIAESFKIQAKPIFDGPGTSFIELTVNNIPMALVWDDMAGLSLVSIEPNDFSKLEILFERFINA